MTIATFLSRRRRMLGAGVATLALHYLALNWVGALGGSGAEAAPAVLPVTIVAQLRAPAPEPPLPVVQAPRVERAQRVRARPQPVPPVVAEAAPAPALEPPAPAPEAPPAREPVPEVVAAVPSEPPPLPAPAPVQPAYRVSVPPSAELTLDMTRTDPDGTIWRGAAVMSWQAAGGAYKVTVEAGLSVLFTRVNLLVLTSEGRLDAAGIAPLLSTEKRRGRAQTATHFNRADGRITFSASERSYPITPGAQDKATLPFQLAGIGRADASQLSGDIEILVAEDRDASVFRFTVLGQEELETGLGTLSTWHLARPPQPGLYSSRLDVWLAPSRGWYPVQIRNTESNGAVTTQTIHNIVATDPGK